MSTENTQYDIFLSYAHADNGGDGGAWPTAIRDFLANELSDMGLNIFFDARDIQSMDYWRHRALAALGRSSILLAFISPNYTSSVPCKAEWDEYRSRQIHHLIGTDTVATVYLEKLPDGGGKWRDELLKPNYIDLRERTYDASQLDDPTVKRKLAELASSIRLRLERSRRAYNVRGNMRRSSPYFVGRRRELDKLHERLVDGPPGVVEVIHGLGGQGKTELAIAYSRGHADWFQAGLWMINAEDRKHLLPLIGEQLAYQPAINYKPTRAEKADADLLGRAVLEKLKHDTAELRKRDPHCGAATLILLDNVSEPELLSINQLNSLDAGEWLRVVATSRDGKQTLPRIPRRRELMQIDSLDEKDALALIRDHQPLRNEKGMAVEIGGVARFANQDDETAAKGIVRELGGYTLAIEQVAVYLGQFQTVRPKDYLDALYQHGLPLTDDVPNNATASEMMHHREKQFGIVLQSTLQRIKMHPAARTALEFAALLPPDTVPWPWLQALTIARHPEISSHAPHVPDPWQTICDILTSLRLLTESDEPEIARIHRLVAAHILREASISVLHPHLVRLAERNAWAVYNSQSAPAVWELEALTSGLAYLLVSSETTANQPDDYRGLANATVFVSDKVITYRGTAGAASLLEHAQSSLTRLVASDPGNGEWQRDLSISHEKLGDLAVSLGDLSGALQRFTDCLTIRERLAASDPGNADWQRDLSVSHNKLGDLAVAQGDLSDALQRFTDCLIIAERLAASDPGNADWQRDLSVSHNRLGDLAVAQGDLSGALRHFTEDLAIAERLAASDPGNADWQRDLSVSHNRLGDLAVAQGDLSGALRHFTEDLAIAERLAASDPGNAQWQRDLSVSHNKLGDLAVAQGDLSGALQRFTDCLTIRKCLAASDPGNAQWQRDLSISNERLGDLAVAQGDIPGALRRFNERMRIIARLAASDPGNAEWQRDLWVSYWKLADLAEKQGGNGAQQYWRKALATLESMKARGMHISPEDEAFMERLRGKVDI